MAKALVITEKPSVARDIVGVLGGFTECDGYFESDTHVVTFAVGHLFELLSPEEIDDKYKRWTLDALPIIPSEFRLKPKKGHSERIRTIGKLLKRRDIKEVVNACDSGREGELIFREIIEYFASEKPIRRLWLQSMTDRAVRKGFEELRSGEDLQGLAAAAACRARSDWLIGMNATRAFTKRLKSRKEKTAWSAGRVQTPTLAMLVERLRAAKLGFAMCGVKGQVMAVMERTHLLDKIGLENLYPDTKSAVDDIVTKVHTNTDLPVKGCKNCPLTEYIPAS